MVVLLSPLLVELPSAGKALESAAASHGRLAAMNVVATSEVVLSGKRSRTEYRLASDGTSVLLRVKEAVAVGRGASDRTFYFSKGSFSAYDAQTHETLTRTIPPRLSRLNQVIFALGPVEDLVKCLLDSHEMKGFLANFQRLNAWKVSNQAGSLVLVRDVSVKEGRNQTRFVMNKTGLVSGYSLHTPSSVTQWTIRYTPVEPIRFRVPRGSRKVDTFTVPLETPKFSDATAGKVVALIQKAYVNFRSGEVKVGRSASGNVTLHMDGARFREDAPTFAYSFMAKQLTILDRRRKLAYRGPAARAEVPLHLAQRGFAVDPFSRQALRANPPFQELFTSDLTARMAGQVELDGSQCDLLQLSGSRIEITVCARRGDHLVVGLTSKSNDRTGRPIMESARRFTYVKVGQSLPKSTFELSIPAGYKVRALPALPASIFRSR